MREEGAGRVGKGVIRAHRRRRHQSVGRRPNSAAGERDRRYSGNVLGAAVSVRDFGWGVRCKSRFYLIRPSSLDLTLPGLIK